MQENEENFLLGVRGNALTHDVELGRRTLESLLSLNADPNSEISLPRYNKSAYDGKGDRAEEASWPRIKAPVDVVLFEGWMLGFSPVSDEAAGKVGKSAPDCCPTPSYVEPGQAIASHKTMTVQTHL